MKLNSFDFTHFHTFHIHVFIIQTPKTHLVYSGELFVDYEVTYASCLAFHLCHCFLLFVNLDLDFFLTFSYLKTLHRRFFCYIDS